MKIKLTRGKYVTMKEYSHPDLIKEEIMKQGFNKEPDGTITGEDIRKKTIHEIREYIANSEMDGFEINEVLEYLTNLK